MGKIVYLMGKSGAGKDTIYKQVLENKEISFCKIIPYTTRPIRVGETNGVEYFFTDEKEFLELKEKKQLIEDRVYHTCMGVWRYFTVRDEQIDLEHKNYLMIGTLESYIRTREFFGADSMIPILIDLDDGIRLQRALDREKTQEYPQYNEMCRRFLADEEDFREEKLKEAGITKKFVNNDLQECLQEIVLYLKGNL
ncbi:MAG: guanylate kinase [Lachnospiraceae bacterium]|nr:guanylate kinase [Lachnospiraceae bacterium]